jgi:hypothetical protein
METVNKKAWVITWANPEVFGEDEMEHEVGVLGPRGITLTASEIEARGQAFTMYDDDGILYYKGYCMSESLSPLSNYGLPNAGCTEIRYKGKTL